MSTASSIFSGLYGTMFQASPILLKGGLVENWPLSTMPISLITESADILFAPVDGLPNQTFASYRPLPGSTLIKNQIAEYPFFTNQIAANAQIQQPLNVSMLMYCPANNNTTAFLKTAVMTALQNTLAQHCQLGGRFTVLTPSYIYTDCLLTAVTDVSTEETNQTQWAYQWDFVQPLITFPTVTNALNNVLTSLTGGGTP